MKIFYNAILVPQEGVGFTVTFPDLPDAIADGDTEDEALFNASEVLKLTLDSTIEEGEDIPDPAFRGGIAVLYRRGCLNQRKLDLDRREAELVEREDNLRKNVEYFELEQKRQKDQKAGLQQRKLALNRREIELVGIEDWAKLLEERESVVTGLEARLSTGAGEK
jgi:predicted RNase H-like HicB family nuclease